MQNGSIGLVSLNWKLQHERLAGKVELVFLDNQDQPMPLARGDVDAICCFEPYAALAELSGFGKKLWVPYDTPMGKTNLGFVASVPFMKKEPELTRKLVEAHVKATQRMATDPHDRDRDHDQAVQHEPGRSPRPRRRTCSSAPTSGEAFQTGLKSLAKMMMDDKMLETEPNWAEFINTSLPLTAGDAARRAVVGLVARSSRLAAGAVAAGGASARLYPPVLLPPPAKVAGGVRRTRGRSIAANAARQRAARA